VRYLLLIYSDPALGPQLGTPELDAQRLRWNAYTEALQASGNMLAGDALQGAETATSVRVRGGQQLTTDGPFAETKEILGGFYMIDVDDLDQALALAAKMPNIEYGTVEVRPVLEYG
jgi:hypothetical protein